MDTSKVPRHGTESLSEVTYICPIIIIFSTATLFELYPRVKATSRSESKYLETGKVYSTLSTGKNLDV